MRSPSLDSRTHISYIFAVIYKEKNNRINHPKLDLSPGNCQSHTECAGDEICLKGSCTNPCQLTACGDNAVCEAKNHTTSCKCSGEDYVEDLVSGGCKRKGEK